jgi:hypothetical protein
LTGGLYLLVPAALWGATPGLMLVGRLWLRPSDGRRVGALHGVLRAIGAFLFAPLHAALLVLAFFGTPRRYRARGTNKIYKSRWGLAIALGARRSVADFIYRTETAPRFRADDGRG